MTKPAPDKNGAKPDLAWPSKDRPGHLALTQGIAHVLESISDLLVVFDNQWRFVYLNRRALEESGEPPEELLGRSLWEKYPHLVGTEVEARYRRALAVQEADHFVVRGSRASRWYEVHAYPSLEGLTVYSRDITERHQAEQALAESEQRHRLITELTSEYTYVCHLDPDGMPRMQAATEGFFRVTGYTPAALEASGGIPRLIHPEDMAQVHEMVGRALTGESGVGELRIVTASGEVRWVRYSIQPLRDETRGGVIQIIGAVQDITERKRAEEALRETEERFRAFMDHSPALAWMKDSALRFVYVNRTWEQRFRKKLAEVHGLTDLDMKSRDVGEELRQHDRVVLASGRATEFEETVPDADGQMHRWQVYKFPFANAIGQQFVGGMAVDVTEQRQAEQRLQALSRRVLEVQEQERHSLARELHDEVGQVLTGLLLTLEAAQGGILANARTALAEAQGIVRELLGQVRELSLRLRPSILDDLGLLPALTWHFERYTKQTGIRVAFAHHGLAERLSAEVETAGYRIVQEALTNVARHGMVQDVEARVWCDGAALHLEVRDRGCGFDPAGVRGTGGLSGMQERAALLGGRLVVDSRIGTGTVVAAELPVRAEGAPDEDP